jgi:hypothetical protein
VVADPDDPAAIVAAVRELRRRPEQLAEMGRRARHTAAEYERTRHLEIFAQALEQAL